MKRNGYFESLLNTFEANVIFEVDGAVASLTKLSLSKSRIHAADNLAS